MNLTNGEMIRKTLKDKQRIVIKIGSSSITHEETGALNLTKLEILVRELCDLKNQGKDVVLVSSGAIAVGSKIERAKLDVVLPAGTYECTAYFHNLDPETGDIIGTAGAIITITIQH